MKNTVIIRNFWFAGLILLLALAVNSAAQIKREAVSVNAGSLVATVNQFRADLGGANNGVGNSYRTGYRQIDWEDLPASINNASVLYDYYNTVSPRGVIISPYRHMNAISIPSFYFSRDNFQIYNAGFQPFSGNTMFSSVDSTQFDVSFVVPGTKTPASVSGFGMVFSDVDHFGMSWISLYDENGKLIENFWAKQLNNGLSFIGVAYTDGTRIARVTIQLGNKPLWQGGPEGSQGSSPNDDKVTMDDIIYSEPRAIEHHKADFDGDGTSDLAVFRPSEGMWYMMNSGTNTFSQVPFGTAGDIPVDGDFDGDSRSDYAVFRPSTATWWVLRSSDLGAQAAQFGLGGDKPVPGDYDKDGLTDYAVWRDGMYWILQSSNGEGVGRQFGLTGDIPIGAPIQ